MKILETKRLSWIFSAQDEYETNHSQCTLRFSWSVNLCEHMQTIRATVNKYCKQIITIFKLVCTINCFSIDFPIVSKSVFFCRLIYHGRSNCWNEISTRKKRNDHRRRKFRSSQRKASKYVWTRPGENVRHLPHGRFGFLSPLRSRIRCASFTEQRSRNK